MTTSTKIITTRYERHTTGITSNRALEEWPEVFGDGLLASAALDRLTHHARTLVITGPSYRQRERRKEGELFAGPAPPSSATTRRTTMALRPKPDHLDPSTGAVAELNWPANQENQDWKDFKAMVKTSTDFGI